MHKTVAQCLSVTVWMLGGAFVASGTSAQGPETYGQRLVDETIRQHPEVHGMELALMRGKGCVTVAATDRRDIGDKCDGHERELLRTGKPYVEAPTSKDPVYDITQTLHDASGTLIGAVMIDMGGGPSEGQASVLARAEAIRREIESRIPSASQLTAPQAAAQQKRADNYDPKIDPADFVAGVTNAYYPLVPGTTYRFRGTGSAAGETNVVTVTHDTKRIQGIAAVVVHDQVFENGKLKEDTYDWYAQDKAGNVWYLGEDTKEYVNGKVTSTKGSWEAGVKGAKPGVAMWGDPAAHMKQPYRQEYLPGVAEDMGNILSVTDAVTVPFGSFKNCVQTEDTTALEPNVREHKFYCRGVGVVRELDSPTEGMELVAVEKK